MRGVPRALRSFPTRRSSDLKKFAGRRAATRFAGFGFWVMSPVPAPPGGGVEISTPPPGGARSEEHTSELQSRGHLVCRLLLVKKKRVNDSLRPKSQPLQTPS